MRPELLFASAGVLLGLLALIAFLVEKHRAALRSWLSHPAVYVLSLSAYFTGWAYFGTEAALFTSGVSYFAFEFGWNLLFILGWPLLLLGMRFMHAHRLSTLPGYFALRYGAPRWACCLVLVFSSLAMLPYLALQFQAVAFALVKLARPETPATPAMLPVWVLLWAAFLGLFTVLFASRQGDPTRRLPGVVAVLALTGVLKLLAVAAVAGYAVWRFGGQFPDLGRPEAWPAMRVDRLSLSTFATWNLNMVSSMLGVLLLPHMFHLMVVEARSDRQVRAARWAFPLYGLVFEALLIPIGMAGLLLGLSGPRLQGAILAVPQSDALRLLAFLGGVAAASGMVVITLIALANMILQTLVLPALRWPAARTARWLWGLRAGTIAMLTALAAGLWLFTEQAFLFELGIMAFVASAQLAPGFFLGLAWPRLGSRAVAWGLALAFGAWLYTALLPALAPGVPALATWVREGPWGLGFLRPQALFGLTELTPETHALFWCLLVNLGAILAVSLRRPASEAEGRRASALLAGTPHLPEVRPALQVLDAQKVEALLALFIGPERTREEVAQLGQRLSETELAPESQLLLTRQTIEVALRGPLGPAAARRAAEQLIPLTREALRDVLSAYRQLASTPETLQSRVRDLSLLNMLTEHLSQEATPQGQLDAVADLVSKAFNFDLVGGFIAHSAELEARSCRGSWRHPPDVRRALESPTLQEALVNNRPRVLSAALDARLMRAPFGEEGLDTLAYVPIVHQGQRLGVLVGGLRQEGYYISAEALHLLKAIANTLAVSLSASAHRLREKQLKEQLEQRVLKRTLALATEKERLEAALAELRELEKLKSAFVDAISHDLRIPLTGIIGYAEFLKEGIGGPLSPEQQEFTANILEASRRMIGLLNNLLDYARIESGTFQVDPQPLPLAPLVAEAVGTFRPLFEKKALRFVLALPDALPDVLVDPERLLQILGNLLSNAAKFTPEGGTVTLAAALLPAAGQVRLTVSDTGIGLSAEEQAGLFDRFYQTAAGRQAGGTGLGLSISKSLVEAHGGRMGVTSAPGEGASFWLTLPLAGDERDEA